MRWQRRILKSKHNLGRLQHNIGPSIHLHNLPSSSVNNVTPWPSCVRLTKCSYFYTTSSVLCTVSYFVKLCSNIVHPKYILPESFFTSFVQYKYVVTRCEIETFVGTISVLTFLQRLFYRNSITGLGPQNTAQTILESHCFPCWKMQASPDPRIYIKTHPTWAMGRYK